eukprot:scaffold237850_cov14-Tisochrysis_lutea.AAC.1
MAPLSSSHVNLCICAPRALQQKHKIKVVDQAGRPIDGEDEDAGEGPSGQSSSSSQNKPQGMLAVPPFGDQSLNWDAWKCLPLDVPGHCACCASAVLLGPPKHKRQHRLLVSFPFIPPT